jgi:hypothetical protein
MVSLLPLLIAAPRVLIVGGGPSRQYNQVAIESNVRYFARMLPKEWPYRVLFANGDATRQSVRYTPEGQTPGRNDLYRAPQLPRLDGPAQPESVAREIASIAADSPSSVLLYFTGHGSIAEDLRPETSQFDLWANTRLSVPELAKSLEALKDVPTTILMVQCHSGGFAKLLFPQGDVTKPPLDNRLCGFYASVEQRTAAGCTSEINEANYHDFTSYFVAALTGEDRLGRKVTGADYDHNGKVGMNEAFCWALVNDSSIDTPVCTSDELLRDTLAATDQEVFATPYASVLKWASVAQRSALEALSADLKLVGDNRLASAYKSFVRLGDDEEDLSKVRGFRFIRLAKSVVLGHQMASHPDAALRRRYATLLKDESANPLRP